MYVKINNNTIEKYPYTAKDLKKDYPNTSFPKNLTEKILAEYNVYKIIVANRPEFNEKTQNCQQNALPTLVDEYWTVSWTVTDKTETEIITQNAAQAKIVRQQRNAALFKSDWTAVIDCPLSEEDKQQWLTYRQSLRDITDHVEFPWVELPHAPDYKEPLDPLTGV